MNYVNAVKRLAIGAHVSASNAVRRLAAEVTAPVLVGSTALVAGVSARADSAFTIDTTAIVSVITGGVTTISAIGIAVLSLVVVIKLFKWVQRVL